MAPTHFNPCLFRFISNQAPFFEAMQKTRSLLVWPELGRGFASGGVGAPREKVTIITPATSPRLFVDVLWSEGYQESGNRYEPGVVFRNREKQRTISQEFVDEEQTPMQAYLLQRSITTDQLCFLTSKYVICVCPALTSMKKYAFLHGDPDSDVIRARQAVGYRLADEHDQDALEITQERRFGDGHCQAQEVRTFAWRPTGVSSEQMDLTEVFAKEWTFRLSTTTKP